jgi:hypothetical protein
MQPKKTPSAKATNAARCILGVYRLPEWPVVARPHSVRIHRTLLDAQDTRKPTIPAMSPTTCRIRTNRTAAPAGDALDGCSAGSRASLVARRWKSSAIFAHASVCAANHSPINRREAARHRTSRTRLAVAFFRSTERNDGVRKRICSMAD